MVTDRQTDRQTDRHTHAYEPSTVTIAVHACRGLFKSFARKGKTNKLNFFTPSINGLSVCLLSLLGFYELPKRATKSIVFYVLKDGFPKTTVFKGSNTPKTLFSY